MKESIFNMKFKSVPFTVPPDLFGTVGRGDQLSKFSEEFRAKLLGSVVLVIRKDNKPGCFSMMRIKDQWDIAYYASARPSELIQWITRPIHERIEVEEPCFRQNNPKYKYIAMTMIEMIK